MKPLPYMWLQGVVTQILHRRLKVTPPRSKAFVTDISRMLVKGIAAARKPG